LRSVPMVVISLPVVIRQFFDDAGGSLDDFAGGDLVDEGGGQLLDSRHALTR